MFDQSSIIARLIEGSLMRALTAVLLLLIAGLACADDARDPNPDLMPAYYDTLDEAGLAGLRLAAHFSVAYEFGGRILETTNGKFRIERPHTDFKGDQVYVERDDTIDWAGYSLVADFHTHPCLPWSHYPRYFSDADVRITTKYAVVGYMADLCTGDARRFVSGSTPADHCWKTDDDDDDLDGQTPIVLVIIGLKTFPPIQKATEPMCGSSGEFVDQLSANWRPIIEETPGPKTEARGMTSW